jgi:hypothetical protein
MVNRKVQAVLCATVTPHSQTRPHGNHTNTLKEEEKFFDSNLAGVLPRVSDFNPEDGINISAV